MIFDTCFFKRFSSSAVIGDQECINITIVADLLYEGVNETFDVSLATAGIGIIGFPSSATVVIFDSDDPPITEGNSVIYCLFV